MSRVFRFGLALLAVAALTTPPIASADQRRGGPPPRAGAPHPGPPHVVHREHVVFIGGYFYDPFFGPYPWWPHPAYPYPYWPVYDARAQVRLQITPKNTAVYVDDFYAGTVDDFDGFWQRLPLPPGGHTITLYLEGFVTSTHRVYMGAGSSFNLKLAMEPLRAGEASEPPVAAPPVPSPPDGTALAPITPASARAAASAPAPAAVGYGTLAIRVHPAGADVVIDGDRWKSSDGEHFELSVATGPHHVRIEKPGYQPYEADVTVAEGGSSPVNVSLQKR